MGEPELGESKDSVLRGFLLVIACDVLAFLSAVIFLDARDALSLTILVFVLPLAQVIWVAPLAAYLFSTGRTNVGKGVLLCAATKLLLLGAYCGVMSVK